MLSLRPLAAAAQQPFATDDVEVASRHRFHLELNVNHDWLPRAAEPALRQWLLESELLFGVAEGVELGALVPALKVVTASASSTPGASGMGDLVLSLKKRFGPAGSPASRRFALSALLSLPTGDRERGLGSGRWDLGCAGVLQLSLGEKTTARLNLGILLAGNTQSGVEGIRNPEGVVLTGAGSLTRQVTRRLLLGIETSGAYAPRAELRGSQLRLQLGGNLRLRQGMTLDFGALVGHFDASPRAGLQLGMSIDL